MDRVFIQCILNRISGILNRDRESSWKHWAKHSIGKPEANQFIASELINLV